jgi:hypothetical protein
MANTQDNRPGMKLRFNDGMEFNTEGKLRAVQRSDGWYVTGQGMLIPVVDRQEADDLIQAMQETRRS